MATGLIANNLRKLLDEHKCSVYELSKLSGVPQSTISAILNLDRSPRYNTLDALSGAFGLEVEEFLLIDKVPQEKEKLTVSERHVVEAVRREYATGARTLITYAEYLYPRICGNNKKS